MSVFAQSQITITEISDGIKGDPGVSSYTHIAYATNATGTAGFSLTDSIGKTYIGVYVDSNVTDSTDPSKYKWTLIKGEKGDVGSPGDPGEDGRTPYVHIAYATSSTGSTGFSTTDPTGKTYIGTYTDFTEADSTNPSLYSWSLIKGDKGDKGNPGDNAIAATLTNDASLIPTDSAGNNGNYSGVSTTMIIYNGGSDDSVNWTVTATTSNITGTLAGKTYTVTGISADKGYVDLTAARSGFSSITRRFNLSKIKAAAAGQNATTYWLVNSVPAIKASNTGAYTPASITVAAKAQTGTSSPANYSGRFIISDSTDGTNFTARYTSSANESSKSYTPSAGKKAIKVQLFLAGGTSNLLDEQIIPIVTDGTDGVTTYSWLKYADDANGTGLSDSPDGKRYLGIAHNKTTNQESSNPADYNWSPLYDNVVVGGRNLITGTSGSYTTGTMGEYFFTYQGKRPLADLGLAVGDQITLSFFARVPAEASGGVYPRFSWYKADGTYTTSTGGIVIQPGTEGFTTYSSVIPADTTEVEFAAQRTGAGAGAIAFDFEYAKVQSEKGNVASDWQLAPEDIENSIEGRMTGVTVEYNAAIETNTNEINLSVDSKISDSEGDLKEYVATQIKATEDSFNITFTEVGQTTDRHEGELAEINTYFDFSPEGLNIGKSDSPLQINLSNEQMDFIDNGLVVAYVNGQKMYIDSLEVLTNIIIGNHKIEKYNSDITLIKWVGGA